MTAKKNIPVIVHGNPNSSSGVSTIAFHNAPSFKIKDVTYAGFSNCSYFFTIRSDQHEVVYSLVKNHVSSYGATRGGTLVIAFSIERGYCLDGGLSPYDVLIALKNAFLEANMICKNPQHEEFSYNQSVDEKALENVVRQYSLIPCSKPYMIMSENGPKAYIECSEDNIKKLLFDINYPEFEEFSEIIIATSAKNSPYTPLNNIKIPRPKKYMLVEDGVKKRYYSDVHEKIIVSSKEDSLCYDNKTEVFTIQELLDRRIISGINLQEENETIIVCTTGWAELKKKKIELRILPSMKGDTIYHLINVEVDGRKVDVTNNIITLVGSQIVMVANTNVSLTPNDLYDLSKYEFDSNYNTLTISLREKRPIGPTGGKRKENGPLAHIPSSPVVDVTLILPKKIFPDIKDEFGEYSTLEIEQLNKIKGKWDVIGFQTVDFRNKNQKEKEGHVYIPKNNVNDIFLRFETRDYIYTSKSYISIDKEKDSLSADDFKRKDVPLISERQKSFIKIVSSFLLGFMLGIGIVFDSIQKATILPNKASHIPQTVINNDTITKTNSQDIQDSQTAITPQ